MTASSSARRALLLSLGPLVAVALFLLSFAGTATSIGPRSLPVAIVGPPMAATGFQAALDREPGAYDVRAVSDVASARRLVLDREVYGAFVLDGGRPAQAFVASAASPAVASALRSAATAAGVSDVVDLVPNPPDDARGAGLASGALPITIAGVIAGTLMALLVRTRRLQVLGIATSAILVAAMAVAILHGWLGSLAGNPLAEAGTIALGVGAIASLLVGCYAVAGRVGLVVVDLLLVLVGNPLSAANAAPELLPTGWSFVGHWMPLGATVDALRGVSSFDGAGAGAPLLVLCGWIVLGLCLLALRRRTSAGPLDPAEEQHQPDPPARRLTAQGLHT